jgi:hypothetical protein
MRLGAAKVVIVQAQRLQMSHRRDKSSQKVTTEISVNENAKGSKISDQNLRVPRL